MPVKHKEVQPAIDSTFITCIADLIDQSLTFKEQRRTSESFTFSDRKHAGSQIGIMAVQGKLTDQGVVKVRFELLRTLKNVRLPINTLFKQLSRLGERTRLVQPAQTTKSGTIALWAEIGIQASPMSIARSNALIEELSKLDRLAKSLQSRLPEDLTDHKIERLYEEISEYLVPVMPSRMGVDDLSPPLLEWSEKTIACLDSSLPVALSAPFPVVESYALSLLAGACASVGNSLGRVAIPAVNAKVLLEISAKAPGIMVVPAVRVGLGTDRYDIGRETRSLLELASSSRTPFLFTGSLTQLQRVFHGGQGGDSDPLMPVVRHVPEINLELLVKHAVESACQSESSLSPADREPLVQNLLEPLSELPLGQALGCLPAAATFAVKTTVRGNGDPDLTRTHIARLAGLKETFAGLRDSDRSGRALHVQDNLVSTFTGADFLEGLKHELFAQDAALETLAASLRRQSLNRPDHQPIRYCAQGTPGTGKTRSAELTAESLGMPYINIDAAAMNDAYTASAQLLGSGRGIVGSHESGELEKAAKHHRGAMVEISDMDHAKPEVRNKLASLFLGILESGMAQSAAGPKFCCANLIFAFTINLADGKDEEVRKNIGFGPGLSEQMLQHRVAEEIKEAFSSAFLSRIGAPILFAPLSGEALALIVEREVERSVRTTFERLHLATGEIVIAEGLGRQLMEALKLRATTSGAREIAERVCELTDSAVQAFINHNPEGSDSQLVISLEEQDQLTIETETNTQQS